MDRAVEGDFTIGGRGNNRSFHGKVASMVITTLKTNDTMPSDAEIELMIKSLEALVGIDGGILSRVPIKMLREAYKQLGELTSNMPSNELSRVVEIDGIEYGIIPDFNELTLGEFVDLDNYLQDNYNNLNKIFTSNG